eukprot:5374367-Amphidinium_carterae.1
MAEWIKHRPMEPEIAGSSPTGVRMSAERKGLVRIPVWPFLFELPLPLPAKIMRDLFRFCYRYLTGQNSWGINM